MAPYGLHREKNPFMPVDGARKRALTVAEQFRFYQCFGKLRKIQRDKSFHETFLESLSFAIERYVTRAPDGNGGSSFPGSGFPKQQGGKVFHPIPEQTLIPAHVRGKDVAPEFFPEPPDAGTAASQTLPNEIEGAPQLKEKSEISARVFLAKAPAHYQGDDFSRERDTAGDIAARDLVANEFVEIFCVEMERLEEESR